MAKAKPWSRLFSSYYAGGLTKEAGISIDEQGFGALKKSVIRLSNLVIPIVSVTTGNGVGGKKLATFPGGRIIHFGTIFEGSLSIASAKQADYTDATPEGDVGIGTLAPANADAFGTDATDDNLATGTPFIMASFADASVSCPPEAQLSLDGHTTPVPIFFNALVDAADIDDGVSTELLASGTVTITWMNLGDHS